MSITRKLQHDPAPTTVSAHLPNPFGLQLRAFQEIFRGTEEFKIPAPVPAPLTCSSASLKNLQHPRSWRGSVPEVVLFFNVLYLM